MPSVVCFVADIVAQCDDIDSSSTVYADNNCFISIVSCLNAKRAVLKASTGSQVR